MSFAADYTEIVTKTGVDFHGKLKMQFENFKPDDPVELLFLTTRANNALRRAKIDTMGVLMKKLPTLGSLRGVGKDTVKNIKTTFVDYWYSQLNREGKLRFWAYTIVHNEEEDEVT